MATVADPGLLRGYSRARPLPLAPVARTLARHARHRPVGRAPQDDAWMQSASRARFSRARPAGRRDGAASTWRPLLALLPQLDRRARREASRSEASRGTWSTWTALLPLGNLTPPWSTWSAVINRTSRAGGLRSTPSGPDDWLAFIRFSRPVLSIFTFSDCLYHARGVEGKLERPAGERQTARSSGRPPPTSAQRC